MKVRLLMVVVILVSLFTAQVAFAGGGSPDLRCQSDFACGG